MDSEKKKYRLLLVGAGERVTSSISGLLPPGQFQEILRASGSGEARRLLLENPVDIVLISAPLPEEYGTELALDLSEKPIAVAMLVKADEYLRVCDRVEEAGVLTISRPVGAQSFYADLRILMALSSRLNRMEKRVSTLQEKMADIRTVNRAKWLLIEHHHMSEKDAHYYIEKQAMDTRLSRREIAQSIIRTYDE